VGSVDIQICMDEALLLMKDELARETGYCKVFVVLNPGSDCSIRCGEKLKECCCRLYRESKCKFAKHNV
jgi:hypothetical protein